MYRAAIIGCGHRAADHADAYGFMPDAELVACYAPTAARREDFAKRYGIAAYGDLAALVKNEKPDLVHVITWPDVRAELMETLSALGVPAVTVEKPLAIDHANYYRLRRLEAETDTRFGVCHQVRWQPALVKCQEAVNSGALGEPMLLDLSAGMNIFGQGTHVLNYIYSLNKEARVTMVYGNAGGWDTAEPKIPAPAVSEALLTFENGARGLWVSGEAAPRCGDPATVYQHVRVAAHCERGRVLFEEFGKYEIVSPAGTETGPSGFAEGWRHQNVVAQAGFHEAMLRWLEGGKPAGTSLSQSLHEVQVMLALYKSSLTGKPVYLKDFEPEEDLVEQYYQRQGL